MQSHIRFDDEGQEYHIYSPGIPLRFDEGRERKMSYEKETDWAEVKRLRQEVRHTAGEILDVKVKKYIADHPAVDYRTAMYSILNEDDDLKQNYAL